MEWKETNGEYDTILHNHRIVLTKENIYISNNGSIIKTLILEPSKDITGEDTIDIYEENNEESLFVVSLTEDPEENFRQLTEIIKGYVDYLLKFKPEDLKKYEGYEITIRNHKFILSFEESMSGELAVWKNDIYSIYSTPNFEFISVPIDIHKNGVSIGTYSYTEPVCSFYEYLVAVKILGGYFIKEML